MSAVPFVVRNTRFGTSLGTKIPFEDVLTSGSMDTSCNFTMPETAENLAEKYGLHRTEVDQYALQSQQRWKAGKQQLYLTISHWLKILRFLLHFWKSDYQLVAETLKIFYLQ